jgi:hypothetical protein
MMKPAWIDRKKKAAMERSKIAREAKPWGNVVMGFNAYRRGASPVSCPFVLGTDNWVTWFMGWMEGRTHA